ncbi:Hsp20/alpha crystallin family protein [Streptomyces bobili]|uniref:Hsp20/alpha crystallin family protein n=1 Tax=Streptomyces bobili TaxID=67280 RepID=UPI00341DD7A5
MLMRTDPSPILDFARTGRYPYREFDRLAQQVFGTGTGDRPAAMPMDAYRSGDDFLVHFDLPGIDPETIDLDVERNVLNVRAERRTPAPEGAELLVAERPAGTFTRQLFLGDTLDVDRIDASYEAGVLTLRIPVAEQAKPRRIQISGGDGGRKQIGG